MRDWSVLKVSSLLRFGVVGALNTVLDIAVFVLLTRVCGLHPLLANPISYSVGLINSFICNKVWTFGGVAQRLTVSAQFVRFGAFNLAGLVLSTAVVAALQSRGAMTAKLVSVPLVFAWNYWTSKRFVYRKG